MKKITKKLLLPVFASLFLAGSVLASNVRANEQINEFSFPSCTTLLESPGDKAHYEFGIHQIVGGPLVEGADDVYSLDGGNYAQCFCPVEGEAGIQTNWLRTEEPIDGWFFEYGSQWNLGNYFYAAQNSDFSCKQSTPPVGGGPGPSVGGNISTPQCPANSPQQIDQVWFSNILPNQITVHWANKGDAAGFHIAYGPSKDNLIWGVEINDPNANSFTLNKLPSSDVYVSVIAKTNAECGGQGSTAVKAETSDPQVLGATGNLQTTILSVIGLALISLGLLQSQKAVIKKEKLLKFSSK